MPKLNQQSLTTSDLFTEVMPKEAVTISGGVFFPSPDFQRSVYAPILGSFGPGILPVLRQQQQTLGRILLRNWNAGGGTMGQLNTLLGLANRLS